MLTLSAFREFYPEFEGATDAMVTKALLYAERRTSADVFQELTDEAHGLLAAHILALSPFGRSARLSTGEDTETLYSKNRAELDRLAGSTYVGSLGLDVPWGYWNGGFGKYGGEFSW